LAELVTGTPLFPGEHEAEQMACICEILGLPPPSLLYDSPRGKLFFDLQTGAALPVKPNSQGRVHRVGSQTLAAALNGRGDALFLDFLTRCLQWDPKRRMTAAQALQHPWVAAGMRNFSATVSRQEQHQKQQQQQQQQQQRVGPLGGAAAALGGLWH
jgi:serine/threonine protein kinase